MAQLLILSLLVLLVAQVTSLRVSEAKCATFTKQNVRISQGRHLTYDAKTIVFTRPNCSDSVDLIVNGEVARIAEFPHQAVLGYASNVSSDGYELRCGGSLVSERFVLTVAHCGTPQFVRLGVDNLRETGSNVREFEVEQFYKHPDYLINDSYNDIGLVKMKGKVVFNNFMRPACLWTNTALNLSTVIATGFGYTGYAADPSNVLMKVRLRFMPTASCHEKFEFHRQFSRGIAESQLCVGSQMDGKDTCVGDSGGPIQTVTDAKSCMYHIVGVTSAGMSCGSGSAENIYTQVASYLDWIEDTVWPGQRARYSRK